MYISNYIKSTRSGRFTAVLLPVAFSLVSLLLSGCSGQVESALQDVEDSRPEGWTEETHGDSVEPDYDTAFPREKVNAVKITISPDNWQVMQDEMEKLYGKPGTGSVPPGGIAVPGQRQFLPGGDNLTRGFMPGQGVAPLPREEGAASELPARELPGWAGMTSENPGWVSADIEFNGLVWKNVGIRYKGNSSLNNAWRSGSTKLPFKLDFDEFEDKYPEISNQRFYGFKQLSFSNAFKDGTFMRDALASDILETAGLPAARTAWYEVVLDYGEGPVDLGLYVAVEVVDDTVIERFFGDDSGNVYEGDGTGASLAGDTFSLIKNSFLKENNSQEADWSDIEKLYRVLHSGSRTSSPGEWRAELESIFDTDGFLYWLAISAVMQHWDTYGYMTHNFYLYNNPDTGQLAWISWDHNEVYSGGGIVAERGRPVAGIMPGRTLTPGRSEVTDRWPLIRFLLDDPVYRQEYLDCMNQALSGACNPQRLEKACLGYTAIISPYIDAAGKDAFREAVNTLTGRIYQFSQSASDFLKTGSR